MGRAMQHTIGTEPEKNRASTRFFFLCTPQPWTDAAKAVPSDVTRECLEAQAVMQGIGLDTIVRLLQAGVGVVQRAHTDFLLGKTHT